MMDFKPGKILKNRYVLEALLGKGGMGKVYLAVSVKHPDLRFAIKELLDVFPSMEERVLALEALDKECNILSSIRHPRLPRIVEKFSQDEREYLVMEFIEGETLEDRLKANNNPLDEQDVILIGIQLAEVLHFLHTAPEYPIIYRDLKPSNIILQPGTDIDIKLVDFGVARFYKPDKSSDTVRFGSPGYAAPEQYRKEKQSIPKSDVYALGVIMYQLLTLYDPTVTPFKFKPLRSLNPSVSEELEWIIGKAIELDPVKRYHDMEFFSEELKEYYRDKFGALEEDYRLDIFRNNHMAYLPNLKVSNLAIASLVTGILSIYACQCFPVFFPCPIIALITGSMARKSMKIRESVNPNENYLIMGGMITGVIGLIFQIVYLLIVLFPYLWR
ncbi:MAG: protein kinase [Candidatus Eremiobacterota bacterium]